MNREEKEKFDKELNKQKRRKLLQGEKYLFCIENNITEFDENLENEYTIHLENKIIELRMRLIRVSKFITGR